MSFEYPLHSSFLPMRRFLVIAFACTMLPARVASPAVAAGRVSFTPRVNEAVAKQVADVREYVRTKRWKQAADLLSRLARDHGKSLLSAGEGWSVNVSAYCNRIASELPAEGLKAYREKVDRQAKAWYDEAIRTGDETLLHRVVDLAMCSTWGDDAIQRLAINAWQRGDAAVARRYWSMLLPAKVNFEGRSYGVRFPDPSMNPADVAARLILCDTVLGDRSRAVTGVRSFEKLFPQARGTIAGESGQLAGILKKVVAESVKWEHSESSTSWPTFAGNSSRNAIAERSTDAGAPVWSKPLVEPTREDAPETGLANRSLQPSAFPVVWNGRVFTCDADRIRGYRLKDGGPAFGEIESATEARAAVLYSVPNLGKSPQPTEDVDGSPRFTLTIADGRLFARMGSPITGRAADETRAVRSRLVCLDLERQAGKLIWLYESRKLGDGWEFEGAPIVVGEKLFVAARRRTVGTELYVLCLAATTGKLNWSTRIGSAVATGNDSANHISHLLPSAQAGRLFLATKAGAVAAVETRAGRLLWVATYPTSETAIADSGPAVCLVHRNVVYLAATEAGCVFAFDAASGIRLWQHELRGGVRYTLGVVNGTLVVSGRRLWGLNADSGKVNWTVGYKNPTGHGFGCGVIAGNSVYWPLRREVLVVDSKTGKLHRRINLARQRRGRGGNLLLHNDRLIVAEPNRLRVYGTQPGKPGLK